MQNKKTLYLAQAGVIAALYIALTVVFAPFSFGEIQVRIAEALTILPAFTAAALPGLYVGCLLGNILGGAVLPDVIFGSLATLLGALGTRVLRNAHPFLAPVPPIVANVLIVPWVLKYAYVVDLPIPFMMFSVGVGEVISCGVLGMILYFALKKRKDTVFKDGDR
ncbi:MAG: QueT transporter family protein [Firmicutes bacterium]|nr:QueT transporter family protein [Bacillota bacterium]